MPRKSPETIQEIRYEYSLKPNQPIVEELTRTLKETNETLKVARYGGIAVGVAGATAVTMAGFFIFKGVEKLAKAWAGEPLTNWANKDKNTNPITGEELSEGWKGQHYVLDWLFG